MIEQAEGLGWAWFATGENSMQLFCSLFGVSGRLKLGVRVRIGVRVVVRVRVR